MSLGSYLQEHFVDKATFAALAGVSSECLDALIASQAVPRATYVCDGRSIRSAAFGVIDIDENLAGEYFRPECIRWARIAAEAPGGHGQAAVRSELVIELRIALECYGLLPAEIEAKIQGYLPHFWNGTFGLCVADPSTGAGIARKEMLQERLTALTANGRNHSPAGASRTELLQLIDDYASSAMPFSPVEYARSSRKRLVDDLRPIVANAEQPAALRSNSTRAPGARTENP